MGLYIQTLLQNALGYIKSGELDEALNLIKRAQDASPNDPDILRLLSVIAALKFDYNNALELIDESIRLDPSNGVAHSNKGNILKELGRHEEALSSLEEAVKLLPGYAEAYNNMGNVLQELGRYEESLDCYDKAISLQPNYMEAFSNKGNAFMLLRCHEKAMENYHKATNINPQYIDAYWNKAMIQLQLGEFENGWQNYEARWTKSNPVPFWHSKIARLESIKNIEGKNILVWAEQGLGDTLQFSRYIRLLSARGAIITFLVPKSLLTILSCLGEECKLSIAEEPTSKFDFQSPLLSLPLLFGTTEKSIPAKTPYLTADEKKKNYFATFFKETKNLKVGVIWSGGFRSNTPELWPIFKRRNIALNQISKLKEISEVDFYSLQKGDPAESELLIEKDDVWPSIINCSHLLDDFSDTAALMEYLDLIISVDTSSAHLAGALGRPVWILNRYDSCWRWLRGRVDSPWYPTAKIYEQTTPGDWSSVIDSVIIDLKTFARSHLAK